MQKIAIDDILGRIDQKRQFEGVSEDGSFYIKIDEYTPYICTAIHNGHKLRDELIDLCLLSEQERWYEEDPNTLDFISSFPIVLASLDSRYEYDLNRPEQEAIYETAWGKEVWMRPLHNSEREESLRKYKNFYEVLFRLISILEGSFGACLLYDIHSFNYQRLDKSTPLFNVGTKNIN